MKIRKGKLIRALAPGALGDEWERIAIVGSQNSGKSIFLTSLICQLKNQSKMEGMDFSYVGKLTPHGVKEFEEFPFERIRAELQDNQNWPGKTSDSYIYRCEFKTQHEGKKPKKHKLEFLDFPGERIADVGMYEKTYANWSSQMIKFLQSSPKIRALADEYLSLLRENEPDMGRLKDSYKVFMARSYVECYSRQVSPSTFILDTKGSKPSGRKKPGAWAAERFSGLGSESEFVPLPENLKKTEFYENCKKAYKRYQKEVVNPLYRWLLDADQMYVLVDILGILESGIQQYNDSYEIYSRILELCEKRKDGKRNNWLALGLLKLARLKRVGLIVPKCDLVGTEEDINNMKALTQDMLKIGLANLGSNTGCGIFPCSAIRSTKREDSKIQSGTTDAHSKVFGRHVFDENGNLIQPENVEECWATVSRVPSAKHLSDKFQAGDYQFAEVYPNVPGRANQAPEQLNLGHILRFMLFGERKVSK